MVTVMTHSFTIRPPAQILQGQLQRFTRDLVFAAARSHLTGGVARVERERAGTGSGVAASLPLVRNYEPLFTTVLVGMGSAREGALPRLVGADRTKA
jgi:hypothetical protein